MGCVTHLVVRLTVELPSVLRVPHPVVHIYVRQAVEQELDFLEIKHSQQRLRHNVVKTLIRCNEDLIVSRDTSSGPPVKNNAHILFCTFKNSRSCALMRSIILYRSWASRYAGRLSCTKEEIVETVRQCAILKIARDSTHDCSTLCQSPHLVHCYLCASFD